MPYKSERVMESKAEQPLSKNWELNQVPPHKFQGESAVRHAANHLSSDKGRNYYWQIWDLFHTAIARCG